MPELNRDIVLKEYFELVVFLNKSNKLKDQKTELRFKIENGTLFAFLQSENPSSLLVIGQKQNLNNWQSAGYSGFHSIEYYLTYCLNKIQSRHHSEQSLEKELTKELRRFLFGK